MTDWLDSLREHAVEGGARIGRARRRAVRRVYDSPSHDPNWGAPTCPYCGDDTFMEDIGGEWRCYLPACEQQYWHEAQADGR